MRWYTGDPLFDTILLLALLLPPVAWLALKFLQAPYGRFGDAWPWAKIDARLGWFLMELPATVVFYTAFLTGPHAFEPVPWFVAGVWALHYGNRGFVFPWLMRVPAGRPTFSVFVVATGGFVTMLHGYLNGWFLSRHADHLDPAWFGDVRFLFGVFLYAVGFVINVHSDAVLRGLRTADEVARGVKVYRLPRGGAFRLVTNPQYFGELLGWLGFALLTWSLPGVFILMISLANLLPRAVANHRWYKDRFRDYPPERKILVPFIY